MSSTFTNINCEMKSMAVYSASTTLAIQNTAGTNESSISTYSWEFRVKNQLNAVHIRSHDSDSDMHDI